MGLIDLGAVIVAAVAAFGAWAAQRSAAKASTVNANVSGRLEAEREAYERAREFDTETIRRQSVELAALRLDNASLHEELTAVKRRLRFLEELIPDWERMLHERLEEPDE